MKRTVAEAKIGTSQIRNRVKIEYGEAIAGSHASRMELHQLLSDLGSNPAFLACGYETPQKITIVNSGQGWVVEAEAVTNIGE